MLSIVYFLWYSYESNRNIVAYMNSSNTKDTSSTEPIKYAL